METQHNFQKGQSPPEPVKRLFLSYSIHLLLPRYFIVKNSWGDYGKYKGYLYASYPFVAYKTTSVMIHKDALPKDLKKKLGIK